MYNILQKYESFLKLCLGVGRGRIWRGEKEDNLQKLPKSIPSSFFNKRIENLQFWGT